MNRVEVDCYSPTLAISAGHELKGRKVVKQPSSPGDASLSFVGVMFTDARIAKVRIFAGNAEPGADDSRRKDVVMMDDFIFGEPKGLE